MKMYSYIVRFDRGLAPNPYWGFCTLALCTPNHMGIKPEPGDWIVGFSTLASGNKLINAMMVSESLNFNIYFHDPRFQSKKPIMNEEYQNYCGDNFYEMGSDGKWIQHKNPYHSGENHRVTDTKHPLVFISEHFYYFGNNSVQIPENFHDLILNRQGIKYQFDTNLVEGFLTWLKQNHQPGIHGDPGLKEIKGCDGCSE